MPQTAERKVVQTELDPEDYEVILSLAKSKNSIANLDEDPLFKLKPVKFRMKIKANEIDDLLYNSKKKGRKR